MKYLLFSVKDVKAGFKPPFMVKDLPIAVRLVKNLVNDKTPNDFNVFVEDLELWQVGDFDLNTGQITRLKDGNVKFINKLLDFKELKDAGN